MASTKVMYYFGGCTLAGYFLMKLVERDPETLRKNLPEGAHLDYHTAAQQRNAHFMKVLKSAAEGDDPETATKKLRENIDREAKKFLDSTKSS